MLSLEPAVAVPAVLQWVRVPEWGQGLVLV